MQPDSQGISFLYNVYNDNGLKFWAAFIAVVLTGYNGFLWIKGIRDEDLKETNTGLRALAVENQAQTLGLDRLKTVVESQTAAVVSELKELRNDFRTLHIYPQTQMVPVRARAPRAPRKPKPKEPVVITAPKTKTKTPKKTATKTAAKTATKSVKKRTTKSKRAAA
jgi:outer membrane biosynthesis protein TonB